jgi:hypothetical protein
MRLECRAFINDGIDIDAYDSRPINSRQCGWASHVITLTEQERQQIHEDFANKIFEINTRMIAMTRGGDKKEASIIGVKELENRLEAYRNTCKKLMNVWYKDQQNSERFKDEFWKAVGGIEYWMLKEINEE